MGQDHRFRENLAAAEKARDEAETDEERRHWAGIAEGWRSLLVECRHFSQRTADKPD